MIEYMAGQIIKGHLTYEKVMTKFAKHKEEIDAYLIKEGREDLIPKEEKEEMIELQK